MFLFITPLLVLSAEAMVSEMSSPLPENLVVAAMEADIALDDISVMVTPITRPNEPLINHYSNVPRTPASTQKLVTTAVALELLGADFYWFNRLYANGMVVGGTLYGDLVVVGSGDPSLTHEQLTLLFAKLYAKGVHRITGDIIIDGSLFQSVDYDVNAFDGQGLRAYNAAPSAFLVNFGTVQANFLPSGRWQGQGDTAQFIPNGAANSVAFDIKPRLANFSFPAQLVTDNTDGCRAMAFERIKLDRQSLSLDGGYTPSCGTDTMWLNFGDNDLLATKAVLATWLSFDPSFQGVVQVSHKPVPTGLLPILTSPSRSLATQIHDINQYSNNVMTEQLALSLPVYATANRYSDYPTTFTLINAWWRDKLTSPAPVMSRASGLCRDCQLTTASMVELLNYMYRSPNFAAFKTSLPIAGRTGTMKALAKRDNNNVAIDRAYIKTGRLNDVIGFAGYVDGTSGQVYAVAAIINSADVGNNPAAVEFLDKVLNVVALQ